MLKKNLRILVLFLFIFVISICLSVSANQVQKNNLETEGIYINEKITTPISKVAGIEIKKSDDKDFSLPTYIKRKVLKAKINFKSKNIENDIKDYVVENVGLVPNHQLFFSFFLFDDKTMAALDVSALPLINNDPPYPTTYSYGQLCERADLAKDKIRKDYRDSNMRPVDTVIDARTVEIGPTLVVLYATLRELGNKYYTDIPVYLRNKPYYYVSGSIYNNDMYVSVVREKG